MAQTNAFKLTTPSLLTLPDLESLQVDIPIINKFGLVPKLLRDKARLQEIYDLRLLVYEHTNRREVINHQVFPNGWMDKLDEQSLHFVVEDNGQFVAAARLAFLRDKTEFPLPDIVESFGFPGGVNLIYYSRLVVHPDYQGAGIAQDLDAYEMKIIQKLQPELVFGTTRPAILKRWEKLGFRSLGLFDFQLYAGALVEAYHLIILDFDPNRPCRYFPK